MSVDPAHGSGRGKPTGDDLKALKDLAGKRRRWPRRLLVSANVVVLVLLLLGASGFGYVEWRFGQVHRIHVDGLEPPGQGPQSPPAPAGPPITVLLVGSDTRDLGQGDKAAYGSDEEVTGQRSDTIVLVRVVPATSSIAILSIPRDLLVPVAGMGTTRINAAFSSGPDLLVKTIEQSLGIAVNHFAVVNFATFTQIASAIGGIYVYFPTPARDLYSGLSVPHAGCVLLEGSQALAFVRSREYQYYLDGSWQYQLVPESDLARIQRQQAFIKLALKKAEDVAPTDPLALNEVIAGITGSVSVDSTFSTSDILHLAAVLRHANVAGIPNWTYPTVNSTDVPGALDPLPAEDSQVVSQFLNYGIPAPKKAGTGATAAPAAGMTSPSRTAGAVAPVNAVLTSAVLTGPVLTGPVLTGAARASATSTAPLAPSTPVEPDASSYWDGRYVPPGLLPGQVPPSCPS